MANLVIVESPSKAKTINKILGKRYVVKSSVGHVRDLPKSKLGVDVDNEFEPTYVTLRDKKEVIEDLRKAAAKANKVYIASDPDREGEAIGWHLSEILKKSNKNITRVLFREITKDAVKDAFKKPRPINTNLVEAQQARRILDRLVGYKISPLLWKSVKRGLSAGRVQSVALRILVEREREIQAFKPVEYWTIESMLHGKVPPSFEASLWKWKGKKAEIGNEEQATEIVNAIKGAEFTVTDLDKRKRRRNAPAPFITSTMQQAASRRYSYGAQKTMRVAQGLYEGVEIGKEGAVGLITYMRTDSARISDEAMEAVRGHITEAFGEKYLPEKPKQFKSKKSAQDAHECIRPTDVTRTPESVRKYLDRDQYRLYSLIWKRFVASQMVPAEFEGTTVYIQAGEAEFKATGQVMLFEGYLKVYGRVKDEEAREKAAEKEEADDKGNTRVESGPVDLPAMEKGDVLRSESVTPTQHFTKPPAHYTEATLIKTLEEKGIGRPSTYASILSVITSRDYVKRERRTLFATELGMLVSDLLVKHFPDIMNTDFTAEMETQLDKVEEGNILWNDSVKSFYTAFDKHLQTAETGMKEDRRAMTKTGIQCPKCETGEMVKRYGKRGAFLGCNNYPDCTSTLPIEWKPGDPIPESNSEEPVLTEHDCHLCGAKMVKRFGRFGEFLSCSKYPECKGTRPMPTGIPCPREGCKGEVAPKRSKRGRMFYGCTTYPKCDFTAWSKPIKHKCEKCGYPIFLAKGKGKPYACGNDQCDNTYLPPVEDEETVEA